MAPSTLVTSVVSPSRCTPWFPYVPGLPVPSMVIVAASGPVPVEAIVSMEATRTPRLLEPVPRPWPVIAMAPSTLETSVVAPDRYTPWLSFAPAPPVPSMVIVAASGPVPVEAIVSMEAT
ncbi:hypothetical protein LzC2_26520 [Planctomycetes bacterium LzC2]|uniref:Uncharacterized protein n=1 Tax=Alienimonas chondri TaxID=2681879 RepID=A0ABX1VEN1_9PLAN|nr:hypothetical protein [Alienimonas chondri]